MGSGVAVQEQIAEVDAVAVLQAEDSGADEGLGLGPNGRFFGEWSADVDEGHVKSILKFTAFAWDLVAGWGMVD